MEVREPGVAVPRYLAPSVKGVSGAGKERPLLAAPRYLAPSVKGVSGGGKDAW